MFIHSVFKAGVSPASAPGWRSSTMERLFGMMSLVHTGSTRECPNATWLSSVGSKQISDFTRGYVDAVYAKLLVLETRAQMATSSSASDIALQMRL